MINSSLFAKSDNMGDNVIATGLLEDWFM